MQSANNTNVTGGQDNESTIVGPTTTINMANGVDGNNGNNRQTNTTTQANQGGTNPGTVIQKMMSPVKVWKIHSNDKSVTKIGSNEKFLNQRLDC